MLPINILLTVISPYTAFLPMFFITFRVLKKEDLIINNPWNSGLLILFFWSLLVGIINKDTASSTVALAILLYFFVSVYLQNYYSDEKSIEKLIKNVVFFSIGSAFLGIAEKITSIYCNTIWWGNVFGIPSSEFVNGAYRIYSTFGNPNVAGTWFSTMILICYYFYTKSFKQKKLFYAAVIFLFIIVLYLTGSRGAAAGLLFGIAAYAYFRKEKQDRIFLILIFIIVAAVFFILPKFVSEIQTIQDSLSHDVGSSIDSRETIWLGCLNMFKIKPITGWGLLGIYFSEGFIHYSREPHAHNIWITLMTTLGIVGLGIYIYMKLYLYRGIKLLLTHKSTLAPLLISIQVVIIGHGMVDFTIMTPQGGIIFVACSAFISALAMQYEKVNDRYSIPFILNKKELPS